MSAIEKIEAQQKKAGQYSAAWMAGEQLKEICRREPKNAEILDRDMDVAEMSITAAERKIKEWADEQQRKQGGNSIAVPPDVAEGILRKFYGLPEREEEAPAPAAKAGTILNLEDFL